MPIGYSPWTDAAAYGNAFGQQIANMLVNIPTQRRREAEEARQFDARMGMAQQNLGMEAKRDYMANNMREAVLAMKQRHDNDMMDYRTNMLDWRNRVADEVAQKNNELAVYRNALMNRPMNMGVNGVYFPDGQVPVTEPMNVPPVGEGANISYPTNGLTPATNAPAAGPRGAFYTPPQRPATVNPNAADRNDLAWLRTQLGAQINGLTNDPVYGVITNRVNRIKQNGLGGQSPQAPATKVLRWNNELGTLE